MITNTEYDRMTSHADAMGVDLQLTSMTLDGSDNDVVLGFWRGEYVTWKYFNGEFHYGHYYSDYSEAQTDFYIRSEGGAV